jgi:hypothetical protein
VALLAVGGPVTFAKGGGSGHSGGNSADHMSDQGLANTNGPDSADRDKGLQRSDDRMSEEDTAHEKAGQAHNKHKNKKPTTQPDKD